MKICTAKKVSTMQHLNNKYEVVSVHSSFELARKSRGEGCSIIDIADDIKKGDSINDDGKKWVSI